MHICAVYLGEDREFFEGIERRLARPSQRREGGNADGQGGRSGLPFLRLRAGEEADGGRFPWVSTALYATGFFMAYLALPIVKLLD